MASEKTQKRKRSGASASSDEQLSGLISKAEPRSEKRYEPKASLPAILSIAGAAIGSGLAGAGVYGQWFRVSDPEPHKLAPYLLAAGAALLIAVALLGQFSLAAIHVGDAGIALEKGPNELERLGWNQITNITLTQSALIVKANGKQITVPLASHGQAAAHIMAAAKERIPQKVDETARDALPALDQSAGENITLEPPQAAGLHCKASNKLIAFEKDARFCRRCGEIYHKDGVPRRCVSCEAPLHG